MQATEEALMWLGVARLAAGTLKPVASLDKAAQIESRSDLDILYHAARRTCWCRKTATRDVQGGPNSVERVHQALAQSFVEADRLRGRRSQCRSALNMRPLEPGLHEELADIYWSQNQSRRRSRVSRGVEGRPGEHFIEYSSARSVSSGLSLK